MKILYGKQFSKDLEDNRLEKNIKNRLLKQIEIIKITKSLLELKDLKKIEGYSGYYRIRIRDYRLGVKFSNHRVELIRFLHRKDIYRRFP